MKKVIKGMLLLLVVATVIMNVNTNTFAVSEADDVVGNENPSVEEEAQGFTIAHTEADGSSYVEATNSFNDGTVTYYFVTGDPAYSSLGGTQTDITYEGSTYSSTVIYSARREYTKVDLLNNPADGIDVSDASAIPAMNDYSTYFYDKGNFVDEDMQYNYKMSGNNKSIVGLYLDVQGDSETIFYKVPYPTNYGDQYAGRKARIMFNHPNTYIANIVFDGSDIEMIPVGGSLSGVSANRGEYFWFFTTNSSEFVAKNVVLQNIGENNSGDGIAALGTARKNVAINLYTPFDGQRNFEDITVRNCKTKAGYGVISFNQTANNYFKNLDISNPTADGAGVAQSTTAYPIKVEHAATTYIPSADVSQERNIVFDGEIILPDTDNLYEAIYVQDYRYQNILVPSKFNYALLRTSNGGTSTAAIRLYEDKTSAIASHSLYEVDTGYWVVEAANTTVALNTQLTNINTIISGQRSNTTVPAPNIKLIAKSDNTISGFTIPDYVTSYNNGAAYTTNIVVLSQTITPDDTIYPASSNATNGDGSEYITFVPSSSSDKITFPTTNSSQVLLFNVDFKTNVKWTIEDAVGGEIANFTKANSGHNLFLKYMVNVTFIGMEDTNIIDSQSININTAAVTPTDANMQIAGYTFNGWSESQTRTGTYLQKTDIDTINQADDMIYYACYTPKTDTKYTVEYYLEQPDGSYKLEERDGFQGTTDTLVSATIKDFVGYTHDSTVTGTKLSGIIAGDGSLVLKVYYKANTNVNYKVEHYLEQPDGSFVLKDIEALQGTTGEMVTANSRTYAGYTFDVTVSGTIESGVVSADTTLVLKLYYVADTVEYKVSHHLQQSDGSYLLVDIDTFSGLTGQTVSANANTYVGYTFDETINGTIKSGIVAGDSSLELKLYYKANQDVKYTVEHYLEQSDGSYSLQDRDIFNATVGQTVSATPNTYDGYVFNNMVIGTIETGVVEEGDTLVLRLYYRKKVSNPSLQPPVENNNDDELVNLTVNSNTGPNAGDTTDSYKYLLVLVAGAYFSIKGIRKLR